MKATFLLWLFLLTMPLSAQSQAALNVLQAEAEEALVTGRPAETARIASQMLVQVPDSFIALYLLALALADLGELQKAADTGVRAYNAAPDEASRFEASRFIAGTRFRAGQFTRSEIWLRRAANHAQSDTDLRSIAEAYAATVAANPLSIRFVASVAPSDNVNNGSEEGELRLEGIGLTFVLPEDRRALSGIAFSATTELEYRVSQSPRQSTYLIGSLSGQTYILSQEAKDLLESSPSPIVRSVEGSDFAAVTAAVGVKRLQNNISPLGPVEFALNFGTYWEGGEKLLNFHDLSVAQIIPLDQRNALRLTAFRRIQDTKTPALVDATTTDLILTYDRALANRDLLQLSMTGRRKDAGFENSFDEYQVGVGYAVAQPIYGVQLTTSLQIGYRTFEEFATTLDGRDDWFVSASATGTLRDVSYFGFSPSVSLTASRTESTAEENTSSALQLLFGIESNF